MGQWWNDLLQGLPSLLGAFAILIGGWLLALVLAAVVRGLLRRTKLSERVQKWVSAGEEAPADAPAIRLDRWVGTAVFWLAMLMVLVLFFEQLGLTAATRPLNDLLSEVSRYLPNLGAAIGLLAVAWVIATVLRFAVTAALRKTGLDDKISQTTEEGEVEVSASKSVGHAVYALVFLVFLLPILDALELQGLLEPVQEMMTAVFAFVPKLFVGALILLVGWFAAKLVRRLVASLLAAAGLDRLGERTGLAKVGKGSLSELAGTVAYVVILIAVLALALEKLALDALARPLEGVLAQILDAVPVLFLAALILLVAWMVGRLVAGLVSDLLARVGFDRIFVVLGLSKEAPAEDEKRTPSAMAGHLVLFVIMLMAVATAAEQMGFGALTKMLEAFAGEAAGWIKGIVFFGLGLWLANFAATLIADRKTTSSALLAMVARVAIIVLAAFIGLRELNVGEAIVEDAFKFIIGGIALAVGLAFGLGGKEAASRQIEGWQSRRGSEEPGD